MGELEIRSSTEEAHREPGFLDLTGREIGRYRIQQRLGRGGVTTVYQAYDGVDGIPVALKVLLHGSDVKLYNRFRQEAQTAAKLRHDHIVRTLRVGVTPGTDTAYIAMDLVEGEDLAALLARQRRLSPEDSCLLLEPIAQALAYAHTQDVVHRDVKPSNILLRTVGSDYDDYVVLDALDYPIVPLLGDFGIARALDSPDLTSWGRTVGTPAFMAPEQARGARNVDHRADIYALGAVFYRCITGRQPFTGTTVQILHAHVYDEVTISDEVQRNLSQRHIEILQRTLAKDPNHRYRSADELADALRRGANPAMDQLTAAEREEQGTMTLEIRPATPQSATDIHFNVVIPGEQRPTLLASPGTVAVDGQSSATTLSRQQPLDPNFNPELDQKLQTISALILSVLVTGIVAFLLYLLLNGNIQLFGFLNGIERTVDQVVASPAVVAASALAKGAPMVQPAVLLPSAMVPIPSLFSGSEINLRKAIPGLIFLPPLPTESLYTTPVLESPPSLSSEVSTTRQPPAHDRFEPTATPTQANSPPTPAHQPIPPPVANPTASVAPPTEVPIPPPVSTEQFDDSKIHAPCTTLIDAHVKSYWAARSPQLHNTFGCASDIAVAGDGVLLIYEHGYMIYLNALDLLFVSYQPIGDQSPAMWHLWSMDHVAPDHDEQPKPLPPEEGRFYPTGIFAQVWRLAENEQRLGMAKMPKAEIVPIIAQPFGESWLLLLVAQGQTDASTLHIFVNTLREY